MEEEVEIEREAYCCIESLVFLQVLDQGARVGVVEGFFAGGEAVEMWCKGKEPRNWYLEIVEVSRGRLGKSIQGYQDMVVFHTE